MVENHPVAPCRKLLIGRTNANLGARFVMKPFDDLLQMRNFADRVKTKLAEYAKSRKSDVARGAETPELAGVLVQKYGYGLVDAYHAIFDKKHDFAPTYADVDAAVASIDENWRATQAARWNARPCGLSL